MKARLRKCSWRNSPPPSNLPPLLPLPTAFNNPNPARNVSASRYRHIKPQNAQLSQHFVRTKTPTTKWTTITSKRNMLRTNMNFRRQHFALKRNRRSCTKCTAQTHSTEQCSIFIMCFRCQFWGHIARNCKSLYRRRSYISSQSNTLTEISRTSCCNNNENLSPSSSNSTNFEPNSYHFKNRCTQVSDGSDSSVDGPANSSPISQKSHLKIGHISKTMVSSQHTSLAGSTQTNHTSHFTPRPQKIKLNSSMTFSVTFTTTNNTLFTLTSFPPLPIPDIATLSFLTSLQIPRELIISLPLPIPLLSKQSLLLTVKTTTMPQLSTAHISSSANISTMEPLSHSHGASSLDSVQLTLTEPTVKSQLRCSARIKEKGQVVQYSPSSGRRKRTPTPAIPFIPLDQTQLVSLSQAISTLHGSGLIINERIIDMINKVIASSQNDSSSADSTVTPIHSSVPPRFMGGKEI